ncbi:iron chelate uptake ABC transporter family permease subunit [[Haemophilus] felis]|nr:iron chelate uptake ABC transporter family permease subunit [[Haemophilus] felis]
MLLLLIAYCLLLIAYCLLLIAYCIGVSTLLFQTLTNNLILTPSILGFDALYLLLQTVLLFFLGVMGFTQFHGIPKFIFETSLMLLASLWLFSTLGGSRQSLTRMMLVGVVFSVLFRSLNNLLQRMIDPNAFAIVQGSVQEIITQQHIREIFALDVDLIDYKNKKVVISHI